MRCLHFMNLVPVRKVYVSVGQQVELPCDVSSSLTTNPDIYTDSGSESLYADDNVSPHRTSASRKQMYTTGRNKIRHHSHLEGDDWSDQAEEEEEERGGGKAQMPLEVEEEGAYLVLWFIDPDRKPVYRSVTVIVQ